MTTVCVVIDDGRPEYLKQTVASLDHVKPIDVRVLIDDSGDKTYGDWLGWTYPNFDEQVHHHQRRGLGGAVRSAWETALEHGADFVWHNEDDMPIAADIDLTTFIDLLKAQPHLAQVGLKRQPFSPEEIRAGGIVEAYPHFYTEHTDAGVTWIETDHLFVFSPSLIPRRVIECVLENTDTFLEDNVTKALWRYSYRSCYWGGLYDPPLCNHIGITRSTGYHW
jgi:hypothetical protein